MRSFLLLFSFTLIISAIVSCDPSDEEPTLPDIPGQSGTIENPDSVSQDTVPVVDPDTITSPDTIPQLNITLTLNEELIRIYVGESFPIGYTVDPDTCTVSWNSSDERIATVDSEGVVTGVARGSVTVTAQSGNANASLTIMVERAVAPGDYFYSDGTYSPDYISSKTLIGVVFWTGDPTVEDAVLKREHPECTHGLVLAAFPSMDPTPWQSNCANFGMTTGMWIENNIGTEYESTVSVWTKDTRRNHIAGYNNTAALEKFNKANPAYTVDAITAVENFRKSCPVPENTSGWFLPSVKELSLVMNCEYDGEVLDFNNVAKEKCGQNKALLNKVLSSVPDAVLIGSDKWAYDFWTSTDWDPYQAYCVSSFQGSIGCVSKSGIRNQLVRCVLAF